MTLFFLLLLRDLNEKKRLKKKLSLFLFSIHKKTQTQPPARETRPKQNEQRKRAPRWRRGAERDSRSWRLVDAAAAAFAVVAAAASERSLRGSDRDDDTDNDDGSNGSCINGGRRTTSGRRRRRNNTGSDSTTTTTSGVHWHRQCSRRGCNSGNHRIRNCFFFRCHCHCRYCRISSFAVGPRPLLLRRPSSLALQPVAGPHDPGT